MLFPWFWSDCQDTKRVSNYGFRRAGLRIITRVGGRAGARGAHLARFKRWFRLNRFRALNQVAGGGIVPWFKFGLDPVQRRFRAGPTETTLGLAASSCI